MNKITWDNVESHTKEEIQNENVKNGLARCANELKETSVEKWRKNYIKQQVTLQEANKMIEELEGQITVIKIILKSLTDIN
jgi:hypothetical protein